MKFESAKIINRKIKYLKENKKCVWFETEKII